MGVGESRHKPDNIAKGQRGMLASLYREAFAVHGLPTPTLNGAVDSTAGGVGGGSGTDQDAELQQETSLRARLALVGSLPMSVQVGMLQALRGSSAPLGASSRPPSPFQAHIHPGSNRPQQGGAIESSQLAGEVALATEALWQRSGSSEKASLALGAALRRSVAQIVRRASLAQTLKGVFTAGAATSLSYALVKMRGARLR